MGRKHRNGKEYEFSNPKLSSMADDVNVTKLAKKRSQHDVINPDSHGIDQVNKDNTVKEHGLVSEIPSDLYYAIQDLITVKIRLAEESVDERLKLDLICAETKLKDISAHFIECNELPSDWKLDLDTASTLVPKKTGNPFKKKKTDKGYGHSKSRFIPFPEIYNVPLNDKEKESWEEFQKFDEKIVPIRGICSFHFEKQKTSIETDHPFVHVVGNFALGAFNKSLEMHVMKDKHNHLSCPVIVDCKYHKFSNKYWFYITLEAAEDGKTGIYETKVECIRDADGRLTLCKFVLTKLKPHGRRGATTKRFKAATSKES